MLAACAADIVFISLSGVGGIVRLEANLEVLGSSKAPKASNYTFGWLPHAHTLRDMCSLRIISGDY